MSAVSRESYAAAGERLAAYAAGAPAEAVAATAEEILSLASLLAGEPRLRRALSDPAREGQDRAGLLRSVFAGKVGAATIDLLSALVVGRWSSAELLNAVERIGVDALLAAADLGGELAEVEDELFRFGQVVDGSPELASTVSDSSALPERRIALVHSLLVGKARPVTVRLAELAVRGFGGRNFAAGLSRLVELTAERRERQVAYVTVASPLSELAQGRLATALSGIYGREMSLRFTIDPRILGGISVQVGSDLYDGTVARRFVDTRNALVAR
ncbi:F0F1 ATP synthase subunit delta [Pilimelia columellifera subsp. columellifera]|uniref:ATP synthase subunit delta n=2 Tax=Pilimelia TaxID=53370 RepID=A0ABN3NIR1_9ACTN